MLKNTYSLQDPCQKFQKIKNNLKKLKNSDEPENLLIYQDESDNEEELNKMLENDDLESGSDDFSDDEDESIQ